MAVIVLVAPIIAVVILGFEIGPFPRLLATDVYLILITARSRCVGRPVQFRKSRSAIQHLTRCRGLPSQLTWAEAPQKRFRMIRPSRYLGAIETITLLPHYPLLNRAGDDKSSFDRCQRDCRGARRRPKKKHGRFQAGSCRLARTLNGFLRYIASSA